MDIRGGLTLDILSSSSTVKQDVQILYFFYHLSSIKQQLDISIRLQKTQLINPDGISSVLLQVRSFAGNVLYEPQDLQPIERWQQWRKRVREEEVPSGWGSSSHGGDDFFHIQTTDLDLGLSIVLPFQQTKRLFFCFKVFFFFGGKSIFGPKFLHPV